MKKHSLLALTALVLITTTIKSNEAAALWLSKPRILIVPSAYEYPTYALQAGGALYALSGIKGLLVAEVPSNKEISPKKELAARIKKAQDENKVWAGTSLVLLGILGKIALDFFIRVNGLEYKIEVKK